jgi:hypothetical protein
MLVGLHRPLRELLPTTGTDPRLDRCGYYRQYQEHACKLPVTFLDPEIFLNTLRRHARRGLGHGGWGVICETVERSLAQRGYDMRPIVVA